MPKSVYSCVEKQTISSSFHPVRLFTVSSEVVLKEMALNFDEFTASRQRAKSREAEDKPMNKGQRSPLHHWVGKLFFFQRMGRDTIDVRVYFYRAAALFRSWRVLLFLSITKTTSFFLLIVIHFLLIEILND